MNDVQDDYTLVQTQDGEVIMPPRPIAHLYKFTALYKNTKGVNLEQPKSSRDFYSMHFDQELFKRAQKALFSVEGKKRNRKFALPSTSVVSDITGQKESYERSYKAGGIFFTEEVKGKPRDFFFNMYTHHEGNWHWDYANTQVITEKIEKEK